MHNAGALSRTRKILIVDDDATIVELLAEVFGLHGYRIAVAMDGEQALEKIVEETPDLVILDLGLPKLPGEEVCRQVRRTEAIKELPIIMLTGKSLDVDKVIGRVIGADYYMTKPCDLSDLLETASSILGMNNQT